MGRSEINVTWNPPQVPLGRITRYDVSSNGKVFYSGTDLHCTARHLQPNTEYTFVVTVITNEGPLDSKPAKKRTAKDEYDCQRLPLYVPPQKKDDSRNDLDMVPQSSYKKRRKKLPLNSRDKLTSSTKLRVTKKLSLTNDLITDASKLVGSGSPTVPTSDSSLSSESQSTVNHLSSTDHQSTRLRTSSLNSSTPFNIKPPSLTKTFCGAATKPAKESFYYPHSSDECIFKASSNKELIAAFLTNQSVNSVSSRNNALRHHRSSVPDESDKLTRTLSNLSMVNIEPALPASMQQHRSSTFVAQRRAGINSLKNQYTTVTHGNGASFTMELPSGRLSQQSSQSRTFPTGNLPASSVKP
ncbi:hypothetical protein EB796_008354 [Bugula neritina]|uniref:Fibronectin type-III domain-containing protein n=1 Tax=Bugula neritina TaxID=10212 RepID=A0A7J7K400_BUGNE|nr:hypothetical protein EB796_008354 [Bugula neritina]